MNNNEKWKIKWNNNEMKNEIMKKNEIIMIIMKMKNENNEKENMKMKNNKWIKKMWK